MTTKKTIAGWFDRGVSEGATHLIVVCNTFDWEDYPVWVHADAGESFQERFDHFNGKNMQKIMEVYDLKADKAEQLAGVHRTWRVPAETPMTAAEIEALGYFGPRLLPTGEWAALHRFLFTTDLIVGIDRFGYRTRFGYESAFDALNALTQWGGTGDPSGPWIKEKGQGRDRENPNAHKLHS